MAACERCWAQAYMRMEANPSKGQADHYLDLLKENEGKPGHEVEKKEEAAHAG